MDKIHKLFKQLKAAVEYICKWKFRFGIMKFLSLYTAVVVSLVGGWQFAVCGHGSDENNVNVDDWRVEYGGLDWPTVVIIGLVTIVFLAVLFYRDRDEVRKYYMKDCNQEFFEAIYIPYFNKLFTYLDLNSFNQWSYNICVAGDCRIRRDRYYKLREMVDFCDQIQKIEGYETFYILTKNLRMVLADTLKSYRGTSATKARSEPVGGMVW